MESELFRQQDAFFQSGATRPPAFRLQQLRSLLNAVQAHEQDVLDALQADLHKSPTEAYSTEIAPVTAEIRHTLRHLAAWMRPRRQPTPLLHFPAVSRILPEPYGRVLIFAPWNYPFHLLFAPLVGAVAAGNCVIVKPSELAPHTEAVTLRILAQAFDPRHVAAVSGGPEIAGELLKQRFDKIFFTGSPAVGKIVLRAAAEHLTPVTLELGGKSPCLVDATVPLDVAARRIAWGKFFNAGQTCIAPDFLLVERRIQEPLINALRAALSEMYGSQPQESPDYARIINDRHFERLRGLMDPARVVHGGQTLPAERYIAPTLLAPVSPDDAVMQEEIFGPLLPILTYDTVEEALDLLRRYPNPLAFYFFTQDRALRQRLLETVPFGGGSQNDTLVQVFSHSLPFGGRGQSGMGAYHGKHSFLAFSHQKSVVQRALWVDFAFRYPPFRVPLHWLRRLLRIGSWEL